LVITDLCVVGAAWAISVPLSTGPVTTERVAAAVASAALSLLLFAVAGLYRRRVAAVRTLEIARTVRSVWTASLVAGVACATVPVSYGIRQALVGAAISSVTIVLGRGLFRYWLMRQRAAGRYRQRILILGAHIAADEWILRFEEHPELGFDLLGVLGEPSAGSVAGRMAVQRDPVEWAFERGAQSVLVVSQAFERDEVTELLQRLDRAGLYVQMTAPSGSVLASRLRVQALVNQPVMFVDPIVTRRLQLVAKRVVDLSLGLVLLVSVAPLLSAVALAIKVTDRGPVLYRQTRVGRDGLSFTMLKLRTMRVGAEDELEEVRAAQGSDREGPLFKLAYDPRFTRIGRFLDRTSINELPQLLNVVRGEMSLVGPRPALLSEHEDFDGDLRRRVSVRPGITGLWQIEAREVPSFESYRRLDLQYVDNWSLSMDMVILVATVETVLGRFVVGERKPSGGCPRSC